MVTNKDKRRKDWSKWVNGVTTILFLFGVILILHGVLYLADGKVAIGYNIKYKLPVVRSGYLSLILGITCVVIGFYRLKNKQKIIDTNIELEDDGKRK